jgi:hypothetical protein
MGSGDPNNYPLTKDLFVVFTRYLPSENRWVRNPREPFYNLTLQKHCYQRAVEGLEKVLRHPEHKMVESDISVCDGMGIPEGAHPVRLHHIS